MPAAAVFMAAVILGPICAFIALETKSYVLAAAAFVLLNLIWLVPSMIGHP